MKKSEFEKILFKQFAKRIAGSTVEVEQKYRVKDVRRIRRALKRMRAVKVRSGQEHNELYDLRGRLRKKGKLLRLRYFGKEDASLTFKGPRLRGRYKKRVEIETPVCFEDMKRILHMLGYRIATIYRKYREEYTTAHADVFLDHLPNVDWFVEIEGTPSAIKKTARRLGLESRHHEHRSYRRILKEDAGV